MLRPLQQCRERERETASATAASAVQREREREREGERERERELYYCATVLMTILKYYCITILLYYHCTTTVPRLYYYCNTVLLHYDDRRPLNNQSNLHGPEINRGGGVIKRKWISGFRAFRVSGLRFRI